MGHTVGINNEIAQLPQQRKRQLTPTQTAINVLDALKNDPELSGLSVYLLNGPASVAGEQIVTRINGPRIKVGPLEQNPRVCGVEITGIPNDPEKERSQVILGVSRKDGRPVTREDIQKIINTIEKNRERISDPETFYPRLSKKITNQLGGLDRELTLSQRNQRNHEANSGIELG